MVSIAGPVLGVLGIIAAMVGSVWIFKSKRSRVSLHHKTSLELQSRSTLPHLAEGAPSLLVRGPRHIPYRLPFREFLQTRGLVSGSGNAGYLGPQSAPSRPLSARMPSIVRTYEPRCRTAGTDCATSRRHTYSTVAAGRRIPADGGRS